MNERTATWAACLIAMLCTLARADAGRAVPAATKRAATATTTARGTDVRFLRFTGDARTGGVLETADVTFRDAAGAEVRLVAAVHIGEQAYFERLQQSFVDSDAVLYEMVKPKGAPAPLRGAPPGDAGIARLQHFLKDRLNLAFQLDVIDYRRPNFVHADMDAETFDALQRKRGESMASLMLNSMMDALANPSAGLNDPGQPQTMMELLARPDGERQFKLLLARQMGDIEAAASGLKGLEGTVILTERNKTVIAALKGALAAGDKQIAVFFGAAHMPDLAAQIERMGFKPVDTTWYRAWDVNIRPSEPSAFQRIQQRMNDATQPAATAPK